MIAPLLIAFREGLEASLIVGIVFSYLRKTGQPRFSKYAWAGVIAAVLFSAALGLIIVAIGAELEGQAEQIFEGTMLLLAVIVLTWMILWMRQQARHMKKELEGELQAVMNSGQPRNIFAVTFFAVAREGVETALLLSAAAFISKDGTTLVATLLGLCAAAVVGYLIYASTIRLNLKLFFNLTSILLLLFAAGLFARSIHEFQEAGLLLSVPDHIWDISHILSEESTLGQILQAVFGYASSPSLLQVIGYVAYWLAALWAIPWLMARRVAQLVPIGT